MKTRKCMWEVKFCVPGLQTGSTAASIRVPRARPGPWEPPSGAMLRARLSISADCRNPEAGRDALTELLRDGARTLIAQALEAELAELLEAFTGCRDEAGRALLVRNGFQPEREIQIGIGPVAVKVPKVRGRGGEPIVFPLPAGSRARPWYRPMCGRPAVWRRPCRGCT